MMLVGASGFFSASHSLAQHEAIHGHSYRVRVYLNEGACAEGIGERVLAVCKLLDHRMLNEVIREPTMENIARFFHERFLDARKITIERPVEGLFCEFMP